MAPLQQYSISRKVFLFYLLLVFFFTCVFISAYTETQPQINDHFLARRRLLDVENEEDDQDQIITKKKSSSSRSTKNKTKLIKPNTTSSSSTKKQTELLKTTTSSTKNQTKLLKKPSSSTKNGTKLIKLISSGTKNKTKVLKLSNESKNKTKLIKPTSDSTNEKIPTLKIKLKKLNSTSKAKPSNSTKSSSLLSKKSSDLVKPSTPKNKTTKAITTKAAQTKSEKKLSDDELQSSDELQTKSTSKDKTQSTDKKPKPQKTQKPSNLIDQEDETDLVSEFKDLPSKFQETFLPDMEKISKSSQLYLNQANKQISKGFKPIVGNKYAPLIASTLSVTFILIPLILVSLIFNKIKAYFSLQKLIIFIQVYLSIYFSILCLSSLITGLEPLKFFYATSRSTYICVQLLQTLAYVGYLLLLLMYLVLVFSTGPGLVTKLLGLGQTFVGFAVGLHYYVTVFHRAVLRQPPKTSWKVDAIYATCFLVICVLDRAEWRKKAYLDGGEEGKKS